MFSLIGPSALPQCNVGSLGSWSFYIIYSYKYAHKIFILDWDTERKTLETLLADTMGTKSKTASCYSLIGMGIKYIYWQILWCSSSETSWDISTRFVCQELPPGPHFISYANELTISQRKRKLCLAETLKTVTRQTVLGTRISEFRVLNGIALDQIQNLLVDTHHHHHHPMCHHLPIHFFYKKPLPLPKLKFSLVFSNRANFFLVPFFNLRHSFLTFF